MYDEGAAAEAVAGKEVVPWELQVLRARQRAGREPPLQ